MNKHNKIMLAMALISLCSFSATAWIVRGLPSVPTCIEREGREVMAGAVAFMVGNVAVPVPYYECVIPAAPKP